MDLNLRIIIASRHSKMHQPGFMWRRSALYCDTFVSVNEVYACEVLFKLLYSSKRYSTASSGVFVSVCAHFHSLSMFAAGHYACLGGM
jgi:hypothetical protein